MPNENQARLDRRVIDDLKSRSTPGIVFYLMISLVVIVADDFYKRQAGFALLFGALVYGICLVRIVHLPISRWTKASHERLNNAVFFASVGMTAIIWGFWFARFMTLADEHTTKLLMAICTAGLSAGGVVAFVPSLRLSVFFNVAMLMPAIAYMALRQINLPLAISILMFSVYLALMAHRANREYWQALENEKLLIRKSEELNRLSRIDGLTGLYNRRHFDERLDCEWKQSTRSQCPPTLLIGDIDYFKGINDRHGHQAGDEFLRLTASLLKTVFKRDTDIVARYGGEEFIVLLTDSRPETAYELAEEMRRRMAEMRMVHEGTDISATMSIGIASSAADSDTSWDELIARADKALYRAKQEGRNRTAVAPPHHQG